MKILVADDEPNVHYSFERILSPDHEIISASSGQEALLKIESQRPDLVIMDIRMPGTNGLVTLRKIKEIDARLPVIIMTAYGTMQTAIEAMGLGAYEYMLKPFDVGQMRKIIDKALAAGQLMKKTVSYPPLAGRAKEEDLIVGTSAQMQEIYKMIGQVAGKDVTVLLRGESGTGKELVARAIYQHSKRSDQPFVVVNCAAIPETLLESELFGYEKGAFTGAEERRIGKFEQSNGGTMFLDEIGDMSLSTQTKILRVIQDGEFTRLGGKEPIRVDVRLIAATNKNLEAAIQEGKFREDLYYRLNVISIYLPPLRERKEDIPALVKYFVEKFSRELGRDVRAIDEAALHKLVRYDWPGNVRELENCIKRAVVLSKGDLLTPEDIQIQVTGKKERGLREGASLEEMLDQVLDLASVTEDGSEIIPLVERVLILKALQKTGGNQVQTARLLGISRNTLRSRMNKYRIAKEVEITKE